MWSELHFLRPEFLLLLLPVVYLLLRYINRRAQQDGWQHSCDANLLQAMQVHSARQASALRWLYWPVAVLTVLALAGPAFRQVPMPVFTNQAALVVALDLSNSMRSEDLKPSRLQRAKFKIKDLLLQRQDGQSALLVYSGDAFVVTPLTDDVETIVSLLDAIDPDIMPVGGSSTRSALSQAGALLEQAGAHQGLVVLITDEVRDVQDALEAVDELRARSHRVSVLGVGTAEGAPIPTRQGFLKDRNGQIVVPRLEIGPMQQLAQAGGGRFSTLTHGNGDLERVLSLSAQAEDDRSQQNDLRAARYLDEGPWLLLLIAPLLALMYRRGLLLCALFTVTALPQRADAFEWDALWYNADQRAHQALQDARPQDAAELAHSDALKGAAAYRGESYADAAQLFNGESVTDLYNRGNALAKNGDLQGALNSYERALAKDPQHADALYNKSLVEQALQQQQQQQQQSQGDGEQQQDGSPSDENSAESSPAGENQNAEDSQQSQKPGENGEESMDEAARQQEADAQQQQAEKDRHKQAEQAQDGEESDEQSSASEETGSPGEEGEDAEQMAEMSAEEKALDAEEKQAMEQWLRRIKDDPGGLLRRKFLYQYHRRGSASERRGTQDEDW